MSKLTPYGITTGQKDFKSLLLWPASIPVHAGEVTEEGRRTESPGKATGKHWCCKTCWVKRERDEAWGRTGSEESTGKRRMKKKKKWNQRCLFGWACIASFYRDSRKDLLKQGVLSYMDACVNCCRQTSGLGFFGSCCGCDCCWAESHLLISFFSSVCRIDWDPTAPNHVWETSGQISPGRENKTGIKWVNSHINLIQIMYSWVSRGY